VELFIFDLSQVADKSVTAVAAEIPVLLVWKPVPECCFCAGNGQSDQ